MGMGLRTTGRATRALSAEIERELDASDLDTLVEERGIGAPQVVKLRERHHALARLLAEGVKPGEAALMLRLTASRVSILLGDSSFQELVEHYRGLVDETFVDFQKKLSELGVDAAHMLQERMEDPERSEDITNNMLLQLVTVSADRTGHGPSQKNEVNIKVGLADRLMEARARIAAQRETEAIDITPKETEQ